jgi:hypothetical protein
MLCAKRAVFAPPCRAVFSSNVENPMQLNSSLASGLTCLVVGLASSFGAVAAPVPGQGSWETTLQGRDIGGNAVSADSAAAVYLYDSVLNITWLRDGNVTGEISWATASQWANDLVTGSGTSQVSDWRLPRMTAASVASCDFAFIATPCGYNVDTASSELAHLYHVALGNLSRYDAAGQERGVEAGLTNTGSFLDLQAGGYWLADVMDSEAAWRFDTFDGVQDVTFKDLPFHAIAVRDGDVLAVPEPQAAHMALTGLVALGWLMNRRRRMPA